MVFYGSANPARTIFFPAIRILFWGGIERDSLPKINENKTDWRGESAKNKIMSQGQTVLGSRKNVPRA